MTQRLLATVTAVPLVLTLLVLAWFGPLPYVTYQPGPTLDVLGSSQGKEIIEVNGAKTYRDDGQLRMTTVSVTRRDTDLNLFTLMGTWFDDQDAVYPKDAVYPEDGSEEDDQTEGEVQMVSSQDTAIAVAMTEMGLDVPPAVEVVAISPGTPADGQLKVRDVFLKVNGAAFTSSDDLVDTIAATPAGQPVSFTVQRDGSDVQVDVTPEQVDGSAKIGVELGAGFLFPFQVSVGIDPAIGGPSAGLMFSLAIYDTLTPGSLTGDQSIAGTGTISADGTVGPIGGIQQKIAGASDDGAQLFLVPPDNCAEALGAQNGDMRLVKATTMHSALEAIQAWVADHDATLPTCSTKD